jgi:hypothetical protein
VFDFFYGTYNKEEKIKNHFCNLACVGAPFLEMLGGANQPFEKFVDCIPDCFDPSAPWSFRAKNFQSFEMGMDNLNENDEDYINNYLKDFDKQMDFVILTERFNESMLMMRKLLCMDFLDLYVQPKKVKVHDSMTYSTKQKLRFYEFNKMDLAMYTVRKVQNN